MLLRDLVLIVLVTLGAVAASQVPQIIQEYEQRLGGARRGQPPARKPRQNRPHRRHDSRPICRFSALSK